MRRAEGVLILQLILQHAAEFQVVIPAHPRQLVIKGVDAVEVRPRPAAETHAAPTLPHCDVRDPVSPVLREQRIDGKVAWLLKWPRQSQCEVISGKAVVGLVDQCGTEHVGQLRNEIIRG